jgi:hypothetical protein
MVAKKICLPLLLLFILTLPLSALAARPVPPKGWAGHDYYFWVDKVWDSSVLPPCVPKEIPGVLVGNTTHKTKAHQSMNNSREVGNMLFADDAYESWSLNFDGKEAQAQAFLSDLEEKGFWGGKTKTTGNNQTIYEYVGNGYYTHVLVSPNFMGKEKDAGYDTNLSFRLTPAIHPHPKSFNGWPLPQSGVVLSSLNNWEMLYWDDKGNDHPLKWNLQTDKGELPAKAWVAWFDYFGVSNEQAAAYAKGLEAAGWKIAYQSEDSEGRYSCQLSKGKDKAALLFDGAFYFRVGFSDVEENLSY